MKLKQFILSVVLSATAFSAWAEDSYQHIRNATAKVEYAFWLTRFSHPSTP